MATATRLRGNVNPIFTIKIGAGAATSYADDLKTYEIVSANKPDSDLTFAEAAAGQGYQWSFKIKLVASYIANSLYAALQDNRGKAAVLTLGPWGNATPTATQPHFQLACILPAPGFKNEASQDPNGKSSEVEVTFVGTADLVKLTA